MSQTAAIAKAVPAHLHKARPWAAYKALQLPLSLSPSWAKSFQIYHGRRVRKFWSCCKGRIDRGLCLPVRCSSISAHNRLSATAAEVQSRCVRKVQVQTSTGKFLAHIQARYSSICSACRTKCLTEQAVARQREPLCGECIRDHVNLKVRSSARVDGLVQRGDTVIAAVSGGEHFEWLLAHTNGFLIMLPTKTADLLLVVSGPCCLAMVHALRAVQSSNFVRPENSKVRSTMQLLGFSRRASVASDLQLLVQIQFRLSAVHIDERLLDAHDGAEPAPDELVAIQAALPGDVRLQRAPLENVFLPDCTAPASTQQQLQQRLQALWAVRHGLCECSRPEV